MSERVYSETDPIYQRFMESQFAEGMALADASDILRLHVPPMAPPHFVAEYQCKGLVRTAQGEISEATGFQVGIWFPQDYLRRADGFEMLRVFTPRIWHPNVSADLPLICIGHLTPGTSLVDILYQVYDILTYQKYNPREDDCLNRGACSWAREREHQFPIDGRPLKRRSLQLEVKPL
jgi:ubiquitin-protein ligase